jgi:hypothetical protein
MTQVSSSQENTWSVLVGKEKASSMKDDERKRQEAIYELIYTEEVFVNDMKMIIEVPFLFLIINK